MLTDYQVHCPHCNWTGCLFAKGDREAWRPAIPRIRDVTFQCPTCHHDWKARIVGDDVKPLPVTDHVAVGSI